MLYEGIAVLRNGTENIFIARVQGCQLENFQLKMNAQRAKAFITDFNKVFELLAERSTYAEEINQIKEYFIKEYPEIFDNSFDFYVMETEAERIVNDEKKLGDIEEKLLRGRSAERFTNYEGINGDRNLTTVQKINMYQRAMDNATRRKIYCAPCKEDY